MGAFHASVIPRHDAMTPRSPRGSLISVRNAYDNIKNPPTTNVSSDSSHTHIKHALLFVPCASWRVSRGHNTRITTPSERGEVRSPRPTHTVRDLHTEPTKSLRRTNILVAMERCAVTRVCPRAGEHCSLGGGPNTGHRMPPPPSSSLLQLGGQTPPPARASCS